jgi:hypothetical protein
MTAQHRFQRALGIGNSAFLKILRCLLIDGIRLLASSNKRGGNKYEDGPERRPPANLPSPYARANHSMQY